MNWQFWKPKHTVASVARQLASGLRDGSIVLDEVLADEPFDDEIDADDAITLQIEVAEATSDAAILDMVKQYANSADLENRSRGGAGLRIGKIVVALPKITVAMRRRHRSEPTNAG